MSNHLFENCSHDWEFYINADRVGGPTAGNSSYYCSKCKNLITLKEKVALDNLFNQKQSLENQERSLESAKIATCLAAGAQIL